MSNGALRPFRILPILCVPALAATATLAQTGGPSARPTVMATMLEPGGILRSGIGESNPCGRHDSCHRSETAADLHPSKTKRRQEPGVAKPRD